MSGTLLATILGMAVATYLTRAPLLLFFRHLRLSPRVERLLQALPLAILSALVTP